jgi:hypothetical protein
MNTDHKNDAAEPSLASAGSHGEPVAWAVATPADGTASPCFFNENDARAYHSQMRGMRQLIPLYRQPTLTDEEREAMDAGADALESLAGSDNDGRIRAALMIAANTLRGFLNRTK